MCTKAKMAFRVTMGEQKCAKRIGLFPIFFCSDLFCKLHGCIHFWPTILIDMPVYLKNLLPSYKSINKVDIFSKQCFSGIGHFLHCIVKLGK